MARFGYCDTHHTNHGSNPCPSCYQGVLSRLHNLELNERRKLFKEVAIALLFNFDDRDDIRKPSGLRNTQDLIKIAAQRTEAILSASNDFAKEPNQ